MAGACPPSLSIAVANAGGLGACGAVLFQPDAILQWAEAFRAESQGPFQINLWIPDPPPSRDSEHEAAVRAFLGQWGPVVPEDAGDLAMPDPLSARRVSGLPRRSSRRSWGFIPRSTSSS